MQEHIIRKSGKIIGRIRYANNRIEARDGRTSKLLGWYDEQSNFTRRSSGEVIAMGNAVQMLLCEQ